MGAGGFAMLPDPKWFIRARTVRVVAATAIAVAAAWSAFGFPVPAMRGYVDREIGSVRLESLEGRQDVIELRLFLLDWTLRQSNLDPQARSLIEAERGRTVVKQSVINSKLEQARDRRP